MRALILETGHTRAALAGARGLHQGGWRVGIGSPLRGVATRSRAVARWHRLPPPEDAVEAYIHGVREAVRAGGYDVVFAAGDVELLLIAQARERLGAVVPHPPYDVLLRGLDKLELTRAAERAGVEVPPTWERGEWPGTGFPVVIKPRLKLADAQQGQGWRLGTYIAHDPEDARRCLDSIARAGAEPVLQQRLEGRLVAWSGVLDAGARVLAEVQQEASLLWPVASGVSARAVTVAVAEDVGRAARAVLGELGWTGIVQLQFISCPDGRPRLIDLNPRFYGSLALAIGAGANLPAVAADSASGGCTPVQCAPVQRARAGERYHWLVGDLQAQLAERRGPAGVLGALWWAVGAHHSVWSARDPLPAAWYLGSILRRLPGRL